MIKRLKCLFIGFVAMAVFSMMLGGCKTTKALGKDIQKAGKVIEKKAKQVEKKIKK